MRIELVKSSISLLRVLELVGGIATALLGLFIYVYIDIQVSSRRTPVTLSVRAVAFVMLVVPGIVVATGSYLQALRRKDWAVVLVLAGGLSSLFFVVLNAGLNYAFVQDRWGQHAILVDFLVVIFTLGTAFIATIVSVLFHSRVQ
jgi:hypothetical protein